MNKHLGILALALSTTALSAAAETSLLKHSTAIIGVDLQHDFTKAHCTEDARVEEYKSQNNSVPARGLPVGASDKDYVNKVGILLTTLRTKAISGFLPKIPTLITTSPLQRITKT